MTETDAFASQDREPTLADSVSESSVDDLVALTQTVVDLRLIGQYYPLEPCELQAVQVALYLCERRRKEIVEGPMQRLNERLAAQS